MLGSFSAADFAGDFNQGADGGSRRVYSLEYPQFCLIHLKLCFWLILCLHSPLLLCILSSALISIGLWEAADEQCRVLYTLGEDLFDTFWLLILQLGASRAAKVPLSNCHTSLIAELSWKWSWSKLCVVFSLPRHCWGFYLLLRVLVNSRLEPEDVNVIIEWYVKKTTCAEDNV